MATTLPQVTQVVRHTSSLKVVLAPSSDALVTSSFLLLVGGARGL